MLQRRSHYLTTLLYDNFYFYDKNGSTGLWQTSRCALVTFLSYPYGYDSQYYFIVDKGETWRVLVSSASCAGRASVQVTQYAILDPDWLLAEVTPFKSTGFLTWQTCRMALEHARNEQLLQPTKDRLKCLRKSGYGNTVAFPAMAMSSQLLLHHRRYVLESLGVSQNHLSEWGILVHVIQKRLVKLNFSSFKMLTEYNRLTELVILSYLYVFVYICFHK